MDNNLSHAAYPNAMNNAGFSKRVRICIELKVPNSGNDELDSIIIQSRKYDLAEKLFIDSSTISANEAMSGSNEFLMQC